MRAISGFLIFLAATASLSPAIAGDIPIIDKAPAWAVPTRFDSVTRPGTPEQPSASTLDRQIRIEGPTTTVYVESVTKLSSPEIVTSFGNLQLLWHPDKGDLHVHAVELIRDGKTVDILASGQKFSVLRREANLERSMINGLLTAVLQIPGIQVGDQLRFTYSVTATDPAQGGHVNGFMPLNLLSNSTAQSRIRLIWPTSQPIKWQINGVGPDPKITTARGWTELVVAGPLATPPKIPGNAPPRFNIPASLEYSDFGSWEAVSAATAPLYDPKDSAQTNPELAAEISRIKALSPDPKVRTAATLRLVQDKVRYLFNGLALGNYVPVSPAETWRLRFGDCKAKTILLIALLHELGIDAEPAMVSATHREGTKDRLPGYQAFDHVIVKARIDGTIYWLDGTSNGDRIEDLGVVPNFGIALPVMAKGSALEVLTATAPLRPQLETTLAIDARAGLAFPASYTATVVLRGPSAGIMKAGQLVMPANAFDEALDSVVGDAVADATVTSRTIRFDEDQGEARITTRGLIDIDWSVSEGHRRASWSSFLGNQTLEAERNNAETANIPVSLAMPTYIQRHTTILLPRQGAGFALEGKTEFLGQVAGADIGLAAKLEAGVVRIEESTRSRSVELPASGLADARAELAKAQAVPLKISAPSDYPDRSAELSASRGSKALTALVALYDEGIRANPKSLALLADRAVFYEGIGENAKAIADLGALLKIEPDVDTYLWRARLRPDRDFAEAMVDIAAARALKPTSQEALEQLVALRVRRNEFELASKEIDDAIVLGLDRAVLLPLRASIEEEAGKLDTALATLQSAVDLTAGNAEVLNALCWMKATHKRSLDTALRDCSKAVERWDDPSPALDSRGVVYLQLGRYDDAISDFDAAIKLNPDLGPTFFVRGIAKRRKGDIEAGDSDIATARRMVPGIDQQYAKFGIMP